MNFFLNDEQKMIRDAIRDLCDNEIAPRSAEYNQKHEFPWRNFKLLAENGYLNMHLPEPYGGGMDWISYAIVIEELARACAVTSVIFEVHCSLHSEALYHFGSQEQKDKYLPKLTAGEILGAYALTEPGAGSDAAALRTTAIKDGDSYVLNGENLATPKYVTPGQLIGNMRVVEGLEPTDTVVVNGLMRVRPGIKVAPQEVATDTGAATNTSSIRTN